MLEWAILSIWIAGVTMTATPNGGRIVLTRKPLIEALKEDIGYDAAPAVAADRVVLLDWNRLAQLMAAPVAAVTEDHSRATAGLAGRGFELRLKGAAGAARVELHVQALSNAQAARAELVALATRTTMQVSPYHRGPGLGDLSCQTTPMDGEYAIIWTRANVCVQARAQGASADELRAWCAALDAAMAAAVVDRATAEKHAPALGGITADPPAGKVGQALTVTAATTGGPRHLCAVETDLAGTTLVETTGGGRGRAEYRVLRPGTLTVQVTAAEPQWLVPVTKTVQIELSP